MASSCKRRPHHHYDDQATTDHLYDNYHYPEHHNNNDVDDRQHHCSKSVNSNRFTTSGRYKRRLIHFQYTNYSSSLMLVASVFMFVAVLLIPHPLVSAEETNDEYEFTMPVLVQSTSILPPIISTIVETTQIDNSENTSKNLGENNKPEETFITIHNEKLDNDNILAQTRVIADINENIDNEHISESTTVKAHEQPQLVSGASEETFKKEQSDIKPFPTADSTTHNNANKTLNVNNIAKQPVQFIETADSPQTVNNDYIKSLHAIHQVNESTISKLSDKQDSSLMVTHNPDVLDNEKPKPSEDEEISVALPPSVEDLAITDHDSKDKHTHVQQSEVNNDIFSAMVEVHPEIRTSPDFIDSQPGGVKTSESTENLEQSIRNSVKTEIEMEQNLESSPVMEILKDIAEPEIRQTLTEDLIEPALNLNAVSVKREEEQRNDMEKVEINENQSIVPEDIQAKKSNGEEETFDGSNWVYLRGARNLAIETENASSDSASSSASSSSSSSSLSSSSSSSESNSKENEDQEVDKKSDSNQEEKETEGEIENENKAQEQLEENEEQAEDKEEVNATGSEIDDNEKENNAQEDLDIEESKADITIAKTSEELHATVTTPTSDIAILDENEAENVSAEANDDALSVVLKESLAPAPANNEEADESAVIAAENEQRISLDETEDSTLIPDESQHVVIKKVLDEKDIFADVADETTMEPIVAVVETEASLGVVIEEPKPTIVEEQVPLDDQIGEEEASEKSALETELAPNVEVNFNEHMLEQSDKIDDKYAGEKEEESSFAMQEREGKGLILKESVNENIKNLDEDVDRELKESTYKENEEPKPFDNEKEKEEEDLVQQIPDEDSFNVEELGEPQHHFNQHQQSTTESAFIRADPEIVEGEHSEDFSFPSSSSSDDFHFISTTEAANRDIVAEIPNEDMDHTKTIKGSRSVNRALIDNDSAATLFESYPPHDSDQTFNGNLADEAAGIGKALPVTNDEAANKSTIIIILSSGIACLFIVVSVTIFLISFQRQHGTLDIEMQERSCGKDNLDEEDAETFAKLLEVELPPSVAIVLEETEECL